MCGTPSYLAPEVVQNNEGGYGNVVDSWSVGVIVFSMLTVSSPFVENEDLDIRMRIETRTTEWSLLTSRGFSIEGKRIRYQLCILLTVAPAEDFLRKLLDPNPTTRMTAADSLFHPWLAGTGERLQAKRDAQLPEKTVGAAKQVQRADIVDSTMAQESLLSLGSADVSMAAMNTPPPSGGNDIPQDMSLDNHGVNGAPGAYSQVSTASQNPTYRMPGAFNANAVNAKGSRYGLQRRSRVIADAEANGHRLPEPSVEMIAQAASQNQKNNATAGPSNPLKRKADGKGESESSLTPVPEEGVEEDHAMGAASDDQENQAGAVRRSKRGRAEPETPQRGAPRSNPPKTKRGRGVVESIGEEDDDMRSSPSQDVGGVRRSPRNVKGGRR